MSSDDGMKAIRSQDINQKFFHRHSDGASTTNKTFVRYQELKMDL